MSKDELRLACGILGWSYTETAKRIGVTPFAVSKWATGAIRVPNPVTMLLRKFLEEQGILEDFENLSRKKFGA